MLYTQNFSPGIVDEELYEPLDKTRFDFDRSQMLYEKKKKNFGGQDVRQLCEVVRGENIIDTMVQDKLTLLQ